MNEITAEGQSLTINRTFDAPIQKLWAASTTPQGFASWFGYPGKAALESIKLDVRPGGRWQVTTTGEDGTDYPFTGTYVTVDEPTKLVFAFEDMFDPSNPNVEIATFEFEEADGKTIGTFNQSGNLPAEEYAGGLKVGWGGFIDRLAEVVEK